MENGAQFVIKSWLCLSQLEGAMTRHFLTGVQEDQHVLTIINFLLQTFLILNNLSYVVTGKIDCFCNIFNLVCFFIINT